MRFCKPEKFFNLTGHLYNLTTYTGASGSLRIVSGLRSDWQLAGSSSNQDR
ncbi:MAG: hypothetical protein AWU57_3062 [Marinobacter sp. T13-3]|nr:MAG: hypothetical protein AWU57_3062 [Marinobacter sp. T13-3]